MWLESFSLSHFRNIEQAALQPCEQLNVICGKNGQGKTSILEGIWLLTGGKSFRGGKDEELILRGAPFSLLQSRIQHDEGEPLHIDITIGSKKSARPGRRAKRNGIVEGRASNIAGSFHAIVFAPEHLTLVKGSPEGRRKFIDAAICQIYPRYLVLYRQYVRILTHKNALLKDFAKNNDSAAQKHAMLDVFDAELARVGEEIQAQRRSYLAQITPHAIAQYAAISGGAEILSMHYVPMFEQGSFAARLAEMRHREIAARCSLIGVQREDIEIHLNNLPAKIYASQGQQRSAVLSLKLAEARVAEELTQKKPVVLLDDVLSELDDGRKAFLLTQMKENQTFVTSCESEAFEKTDGKRFVVEKGRVCTA